MRIGSESLVPGPSAMLSLMLALLLLFTAARAWADEFDTLNFDAGMTLITDSNLFRLSATADPNTVLGRSSTADSINVTSLGVRLAKPYSLQRFELSASLVDYRYDKARFLNFSAFNYSAAWRWNLTPRFKGSISSDRSETLNSFVDFRAFVRNVRIQENHRFNAEYEVDGVWRVIGGLAQSKSQNERLFVQQQDFKSNVAEGGIKYAFTNGSTVSAVIRAQDGEFFKLTQPQAASFFDNKFKQSEQEARLFWLFSGKSSLDARLAYIDRRHPNFSQRDFSGVVGNANWNWGITGKTRLVTSVSRELGSFVQPSSSYTRVDRLSVGPAWEVSSKALVRARVDVSTRDFLGPVTNTALNGRSDTLRTLYLGMDWRPFRWATMSASLQHDKRSSNQAGLDFASTQVTLAARLTF